MGIKLTIKNTEAVKDISRNENTQINNTQEAAEDENIIRLTEYTILQYNKRSDNMEEEDEYLAGEIIGIELIGKVDIYDRSGEILEVKKLSLWAKDSAHEKQCYRDFMLEITDLNNNVYDSLHIEKAFIVSYTEKFRSRDGIGEFYIFIRGLDDVEQIIKE